MYIYIYTSTYIYIYRSMWVCGAQGERGGYKFCKIIETSFAKYSKTVVHLRYVSMLLAARCKSKYLVSWLSGSAFWWKRWCNLTRWFPKEMHAETGTENPKVRECQLWSSRSGALCCRSIQTSTLKPSTVMCRWLFKGPKLTEVTPVLPLDISAVGWDCQKINKVAHDFKLGPTWKSRKLGSCLFTWFNCTLPSFAAVGRRQRWKAKTTACQRQFAMHFMVMCVPFLTNLDSMV